MTTFHRPPLRPGYPVSPRTLRRRLRPDPPTASRPAVRHPRPDGPDRPGSALPLPVDPQPCRGGSDGDAAPAVGRRLRPLVPLAALVVVGAAALGFGGGGAARPDAAGATAAAPAVSSGVAVLRGEIAAMEASGMPADDPKVALLRDDLAVMEAAAAADRPVVPEPGVDVGARIAAATRSSGDTAADAAASFDDGPVDCEPLPGLLTAADVAGARCSSTLADDGSSLYVAERPDGATRAVRFAVDGSVDTVESFDTVESAGTVTPSP